MKALTSVLIASFNVIYRLVLTLLVMMLIFLILVKVADSVNYKPYEEAFIKYLSERPLDSGGSEFESKMAKQMQAMLGKEPPKITLDIDKTYSYKWEQWDLFKQSIANTVSLVLEVLGLGGKGSKDVEETAARTVAVNENYREMAKGRQTWGGIALNNMLDAMVALFRTVTGRVVMVDDTPVTVEEKVVVPYDRTDNILRWAAEIETAAQKYDIDPAVIAGVMEQESGGNPSAISSAGAVGLMQLMPGTADFLGVNPYDPKENIQGGTRYLAMQLKEFGNLKQALAAYNAGPGNVYNSRYLYISETQHYLKRVPKLIDKYRNQFNRRIEVISQPQANL